jgi:cytoplasmic FMR1 interacting protein
MLELMFSEKSKGMKGGMMKEKNFKDNQVEELQKFFDDSFYFPDMLNLAKSIKTCSDLSNLWFKEFYLELTKQVQFRTSTSLPWILAEFALDSHETNVLQDIFIPLELYNDAAFKTLTCLKNRYIYNEIQAELNLCFDQFMFKLGRNVFRHYKKLAAIQLLESENKVALQNTKSFWNQESILPGGFENILKQRDIKLLGRSIDVNKILAQMTNQYLRHSIDTAISRFESSDLTYVLEMESLIQVNRRTHKLLSKYLCLERFEDMLREVDECIAPCENNGRIVTHTVQEMVSDIIPNFCYNNVTSRYIRSSVIYAEPVQRPNFPNAKLMYLYGTKVQAE